MYQFALLLLFIFGSLTLPACAQKAHSAKAAAAATQGATDQPAKKEAGPVLTFQRTPCFGTCPGFSMRVYANGRVAYEGTRAVPLMGAHELKMSPAAVADLLRQAREAHFDQFDKQYLSGATDLPSTIIAIRQPDGTLKTVRVEPGAPENIQQLFTYFGNQLDPVAQLNGVEK